LHTHDTWYEAILWLRFELPTECFGVQVALGAGYGSRNDFELLGRHGVTDVISHLFRPAYDNADCPSESSHSLNVPGKVRTSGSDGLWLARHQLDVGPVRARVSHRFERDRLGVRRDILDEIRDRGPGTQLSRSTIQLYHDSDGTLTAGLSLDDNPLCTLTSWLDLSIELTWKKTSTLKRRRPAAWKTQSRNHAASSGRQ
jgi:hypothetical protein